MIRPNHKNVDVDGLVYHAYLSNWKEETSSLAELVTILASLFSTSPPVYARPKQAPPAPNSPPPNYLTPKPLPPPAYQPVLSTSPPPPEYGDHEPNIWSKPPSPPSYNTQSRLHQRQHLEKEREEKARQSEVLERVKQQVKVKVLRNFKAFTLHANESLETEFEYEHLLRTGAADLERGFREIADQKETLESHIAMSEAKIKEFQEWIQLAQQEEAAKKNEVEDLDSVIVASTYLQDQLMQAMSHKLALEDGLFMADRLFSREVVDLKAYLKAVRKLSRDHFFQVALVRKIKDMLE